MPHELFLLAAAKRVATLYTFFHFVSKMAFLFLYRTIRINTIVLRFLPLPCGTGINMQSFRYPPLLFFVQTTPLFSNFVHKDVINCQI